MPYYLRLATLKDAQALLDIKASLSLSLTTNKRKGGFLLGSSLEHYLAFIEAEAVAVIEKQDQGVVAFSIIFPDALLRQSEVFQKRQQTTISKYRLVQLEQARVAYYEQLAVHEAHRGVGKYLAYGHLHSVLNQHDFVLTTIVNKPICNPAALPFLRIMGFMHVGQIAECYPVIGDIVSDIYITSISDIHRGLELPLISRFRQRVATNTMTLCL